MALPLKSVLAVIIVVVALPELKAWATGQWYCHRLVPLSITSIVTPCSFPCLLISPYRGHRGIILQKEVDGTPCKISGSPLGAYQESQCTNGVCQLPYLQLHLKRAKRETTHTRKRRGAIGIIEKGKTEDNDHNNNEGGKRKRRRRRKRKKRKKSGGNNRGEQA
uniref:Basic tail secreted protein n=1 Tax=Rhipicephalus zambeziensis TaxID=60191 RepID=A0A224YCL2_9ACAR